MKQLLLTLFALFFCLITVSAKENPWIFRENKGQWHNNAQFRANLKGGYLYLENNRFTYLFYDWKALHDAHEMAHDEQTNTGLRADVLPEKINCQAYYVNFVGSSNQVKMNSFDRSSHYENYFLGNNPEHWASKVNGYSKIQYENLYTNIHLWVLNTEKGLKTEWQLAPHANPANIKMQYEGAEEIYIKDGKLVIHSNLHHVEEEAPIAWQMINGERVMVDVKFTLKNKEVSFELGKYDSNYELIIDPVLVFSTFTGSTADNWGFTATYDSQGNLFSGGLVNDFGYPVSVGAIQAIYGGGTNNFSIPSLFYGSDIAIIKYSSDGTNRLYATYIGGNNNDQPHSMIVNKDDELFILGATRSQNFPITSNAFQQFSGGEIDIVLIHLDSAGTQLMASTYFGGSLDDGVNKKIGNPLHRFYADDARGEIQLDADGMVYVISSTYSPDFPTVNPFQPILRGGQDALLIKFDPMFSNPIFSSYFGGSSFDAGYGIFVDKNYNIYITGGTASNDFPIPTGGLNPTFMGVTDGWILTFNSDLTQILKGTFIGTAAYDQSFFIQTDDENNIYVTGQTEGNYPVVGAVFTMPNSGQYLTKLNNDLNAIIYSLRFGNGNPTPNLTFSAFLVDKCQNVYISTWGGLQGQNSGSTFGMPVTPDAFKSTTDGKDFYLLVFQRNAVSLLYASYFGGDLNGGEHVDGGTSRYDQRGIVYQSVCASCGGFDDFPTTPNAWSTTNNSFNCNNGSFKYDFEIRNAVIADFDFDYEPACFPVTIDFENQSDGGVSYSWDFGDGATSTTTNPTHTFNSPGEFFIRLTSHDPNSCNINDTAVRRINVVQPSESQFVVSPKICSDTVTFTNNSLNATDFIWNFGDGNISALANPQHIYATFDTFTVQLISNPTSPCPDTSSQTIILYPNTIADFNWSPLGCATDINFQNNSSGNIESHWDFGDGTTSNQTNPSHSFSGPGTYSVTLISNATSPCPNTLVQSVVINPKSIADFQNPPVVCDSIFNPNNFSQFAATYQWNFGDGNTDTLFQPTHVFADTGFYTITLITNPGTTCADTTSSVIRVYPRTVANFQIQSQPCVLSVNFVNQSVGALQSEWDFGDGVTSNQISPTHTYTDTGTYQIRLITNALSLCPDTLIQTVRINPVSVANFTSLPILCDSLFIPQNVSLFSDDFLWDFGDGTTSTDSMPIHTYQDTGFFQVRLISMPNTACADTMTMTIRVLNRSIANFFTNTPKCLQTVEFQNNSDGGFEYFWDFGDGTTSNVFEPVHTFPDTGHYVVRLVTNFSAICPDTIEQVIVIQPVSKAQFITPLASCDSTFQFTNQSQFASVYHWTFGDGNTSNLENPTHVYADTGNFVVTLITEPGTVCADTFIQQVRVPKNPVALFDIQSERCLKTLTFINQSQDDSQYFWDFGDGNLSQVKNPIHTYLQSGTYQISLIINPDSACPDTFARSFTVEPVSIAGFFAPQTSCGLTISFQQNASFTTQYFWDFGDGVTSTQANPTHTYAQIDTYTVQLITEPNTLCADTFAQNIIIYPEPDPIISVVQQPCTGILDFTLNRTDFISATWSFGNGLVSNELNPSYIYPNAGNYTILVQVTDANGCTDTASYSIDFSPNATNYVFIPNVFTPNHDGLNDKFNVSGDYAECAEEMTIFDRWGNRIYNTKSPRDGWDGTYQNKQAPEGAYVYVIEGRKFKRVGTVTLIR